MHVFQQVVSCKRIMIEYIAILVFGNVIIRLEGSALAQFLWSHNVRTHIKAHGHGIGLTVAPSLLLMHAIEHMEP